MYRLMEHLAQARKKTIKARRSGMTFNPDKAPKIPSVVEAKDWTGETFQEYRKKIEQAHIVIFTLLPVVDEPEVPDTMIFTSLWGEVLVVKVREMGEAKDSNREDVQGLSQLRDFFSQPRTSYITERAGYTLEWMTRMGLTLDEASVTGLETWHLLSQAFCPSVELVFPELWGWLTASFRGSSTSGWTWHHLPSEGCTELAPDQARLAFAVGNALATLTLDGIVARIDPEDRRPLGDLGSFILQTEQEGILEGEETLAMRALRLGAEDSAENSGAEELLRVKWGNAQVAYREPMGRIRKAGCLPIREEEIRPVLKRQREIIRDIFTWEEAISRVTLLGPEHEAPVVEDYGVLPPAPKAGILRNLAPESVRRANERLGLDPDDFDFVTERFADLRTSEGTSRVTGRTPSPPPPPKYDVHGLWAEERHRHNGGRHRGPPRLRWSAPVLKDPQKKRHRDPEGQVEAWRDHESGEELRQGGQPPSKRSKEGKETKSLEREDQRPVPGPSGRYSWTRRGSGRVLGSGTSRGGGHGKGRGSGGERGRESGDWNVSGRRGRGRGKRRGRWPN